MTVRLTEGKRGRFLVLDNDVYVGRLLLRDGEYSDEEVQLFEKLVGSEDVVVEAGANLGAHTVPLARMAARVLAFEPQTFVYRLLCGNLALNGCHNVDAYPVGLGAENGELLLPRLDYDEAFNFGGVPLRGDWTGMSREAGDRVGVFALDHLRLPGLRLLKADVEGMEVAVLRGARETIARYRPYLYLEDEEGGNQALHALLRELGYRVVRHEPVLLSASDQLNPFPGATIVSRNVLGVPNELPDPV